MKNIFLLILILSMLVVATLACGGEGDCYDAASCLHQQITAANTANESGAIQDAANVAGFGGDK